MPCCDDLFSEIDKGRCRSSVNVGDGGKAYSHRLQYTIRRLLEVICSNLKDVVLSIDDLQVSLAYIVNRYARLESFSIK